MLGRRNVSLGEKAKEVILLQVKLYSMRPMMIKASHSFVSCKMGCRQCVDWLIDREFLAEILSTFILILIGDGSVAQWMLLNKGGGNEPFLLVNCGYGCAVTFGVYIAGGVSGAHMNPAVSVALAAFGKMSWVKVPKYVLGQMIGAFLGALMVFLTYYSRISPAALSDPDSDKTTAAVQQFAGVYGTYPNPDTNTWTQFLDQVVGTAVLLMVICAVGDERNTPPPKGVAPLVVGLTVFGIGTSLGTNCGYAINPARDLAPRLLSLIAGYGTHTFTASDYYFWVPIVGPLVGGLLGVLLYQTMVGMRHPPEPLYETELKQVPEI